MLESTQVSRAAVAVTQEPVQETRQGRSTVKAEFGRLPWPKADPPQRGGARDSKLRVELPAGRLLRAGHARLQQDRESERAHAERRHRPDASPEAAPQTYVSTPSSPAARSTGERSTSVNALPMRVTMPGLTKTMITPAAIQASTPYGK